MYVKRKLGVGDLMPMVRIISKIGISDFKKCFTGDTLKNLIQKGAEKQESSTDEKEQENTEDLVEKVGFDVV